MATVSPFERQKRGQALKHFSANIPADVHARLSDWAWRNRMVMTKAITELLVIGLDTVENKKEGE